MGLIYIQEVERTYPYQIYLLDVLLRLTTSAGYRLRAQTTVISTPGSIAVLNLLEKLLRTSVCW